MGQNVATKNFRVSGNKIIPYVKSSDLKKLDNDKLDINHIIISPNIDKISERGIREYLDYNGYKNIIIKKSKIPYRG